VVYFAVSATGGERHRALGAVARFLPRRWRPDLEVPLPRSDVEAVP